MVTCDQPVLGSSSSEPFDGGGEVGETAGSGLAQGRDDGLWSGFDDDGMTAVRTEPDRVLFTYVAAGRVLQAVVMRHGRVAPGRGAGADGIAWYVESSARCDVVEYPDGLAESRGAEVWTDATGRRISSQVVSSSTSDDASCLRAGTRILELGQGDDDRRYLAHGEAYPDVVDEPYREDVPLPSDAVDSGYRHGDERLWVSADSRRAYVGTTDRVDVWPRLADGFGCA